MSMSPPANGRHHQWAQHMAASPPGPRPPGPLPAMEQRSRSLAVMHVTPELEVLGSNPDGELSANVVILGARGWIPTSREPEGTLRGKKGDFTLGLGDRPRTLPLPLPLPTHNRATRCAQMPLPPKHTPKATGAVKGSRIRWYPAQPVNAQRRHPPPATGGGLGAVSSPAGVVTEQPPSRVVQVRKCPPWARATGGGIDPVPTHPTPRLLFISHISKPPAFRYISHINQPLAFCCISQISKSPIF